MKKRLRTETKESLNMAIRFAISWLALATILAIVLGRINVPTYVKLAEDGERTTAVIVQPDCGNHGRASYAFNVGSIGYSGSDVMNDCRSLRPGDDITIYFDRDDPKISRAIEPRAGLMNELIPIALACLLVPPVAIISFILWRRKNAKRST
jgi:hypothetical protein